MASSKSGERKGVSKAAPVSRNVAIDDATIFPDTLRAIIQVLEDSDVTQLDWRRGDERLVIRRGPEVAPTVIHAAPASPAHHAVSPAGSAAAPSAKVEAPPVDKPGTVITSPFVGTFYRSPSPDAPSFVEVGAVIRKGQVLCIVEAMKLMNEIEAEAPGKIAEVLVDNGHTVEFGQPLFRIEPV